MTRTSKGGTKVSAALLASSLLFIAAGARADAEDPDVKATTVQVCLAAHEAGQVAQSDGKLVEARKHFALCGAPTCPPAVRTDCLVRRDDVERAVPTVLVSARTADGSAVKGARVTIDGRPWSVEGGAAPLDPGAHEVVVTAAGATVKKAVTLSAGEKDREVLVTMASVEPQKATPARAASSLTGPILLGAGGGVALIAGVGLLVLAGSVEDKKAASAAVLSSTPTTREDGSPNPK